MLQLILKKALELKASDIHIKTGQVPYVRVSKILRKLEDFPPISNELMELIIREILSNNKKKLAEFEQYGEVDTSYSLQNLTRFRVNIYKQRGTVSIAFRNIPFKIPDFESLNLPPVMKKNSFGKYQGFYTGDRTRRIGKVYNVDDFDKPYKQNTL